MRQYRSGWILLFAWIVPAMAFGQMEKGIFFMHWGYNRAWYSWSDIHFDGPDYDFTLRHVIARDRPEPLSSVYVNPETIWVPQYNYRVGWCFHERWSVSLGLDHMKYVMVQDQVVEMDGYVNSSRSMRYTTPEGSHAVTLTPDLLTYEHTDGLNLLSVDLDHYDRLWTSTDTRFRLSAFEGIHAGPVIPRSDVRLFGVGVNNHFNVAGLGIGAQAGLHFTFFRHLYLRYTLKGGWIDLSHVLTTGADEDHASQHFWFLQSALAFGVEIQPRKKA